MCVDGLVVMWFFLISGKCSFVIIVFGGFEGGEKSVLLVVGVLVK